MLIRLLSFLLLLIVLLQPTNKLFVHLIWKLNQETIKTELCQERLIQNNLCSGRCVLTAQLQKAADQHPDKTIPTTILERTLTLFFVSLPSINWDLDVTKNEELYNNYGGFFSTEVIQKIFRPPIHS